MCIVRKHCAHTHEPTHAHCAQQAGHSHARGQCTQMVACTRMHLCRALTCCWSLTCTRAVIARTVDSPVYAAAAFRSLVLRHRRSDAAEKSRLLYSRQASQQPTGFKNVERLWLHFNPLNPNP